MLDALLFTRTPRLLTLVYPQCLWQVNTSEKVIYLTFDDGPTSEITPFVLNELKQCNAKATFFCIGKNVEAHGDIFLRIANEGHSIGNHTYAHLNGWNTTDEVYYKNIEKCAAVVNSNLFRPPYGKLKPSQYVTLKSQYKLVMWDVLSFDFDLKTSPQQVVDNVLTNAERGSIVVLHDSVKAKDKVKYALPRILEYYSGKGFKFEKL